MRDSPSANGLNGRESNGQFTKGNKGGPGNPYARRVASLRTTLLEAVGDDGLAEIAKGMVSAAKGGDVAAAKLLFSYILGRPSAVIEPDHIDLHERELLSQKRSFAHADKIHELFK
jgi:hypothetical protein